ncbi:condensation domain-containing protein, partial [Olivibacter sp. CPCC 100613]|uniref:condensation domain-containing protein n=1 Tax=Olivibacter sp. CPCC 100613 TaxID=3079931 RepID=UPI002FFCEBF7
VYRLSGLQEGMLFHELYGEEPGAYTEQYTAEVGDIDPSVFRESWQELSGRHSILRSGFDYESLGVPVQFELSRVEVPFEEVDLSGMGRVERDEAVRVYRDGERLRGIDLGQAPAMRIGLLKTGIGSYLMVWTFHHIILDGWSVSLLLGELREVYGALASGKAPVPVADDRYEDYIRYIEGGDRHAEEGFWRDYLSGLEGPVLLPFIGNVGERNRGGGNYVTERCPLDSDLSGAIRRYVQAERITVNTLMQGAWAYLLHRYTGRRDIVYGVTVSGRPEDLSGVEQRIGLY